MLRILAEDGFDARAVGRAAGLEARQLEDADWRILARCADVAWREAVRATGDKALGLHLAERLERGVLGALEYAVRHSATLRRGLQQIVRYGRLTHDLAAFALVEDAGEARLELVLPGASDPTPQAAQFLLAALLSVLRDCAVGELRPRAVLFRHAEPEGSDEYSRVLRAPVRFAQPSRALVLDRTQLELPFREADPRLGRILDAYLERALDALPPAAGFTVDVRRAVADTLPSGDSTAETIARRLGTSVRTLSRRLAADGQPLRRLRDEVRLELATAHLRERKRSVPEVAFLLGFSESSAFHRWFRRFAGTTPAAYRRSAPSHR